MAVALKVAVDGELATRVASFPRDLLGARLKASLEEARPSSRKTPRPSAKRPPREPLLVKSEAKVRMGCDVMV